MSNASALWYFENIDLFKILCPDKVKRMAQTHKMLAFRRDEFLDLSEHKSTHVYMIITGRVKVGHRMGDGVETGWTILQRGELFGELNDAEKLKRYDFAQALENCTISPLTIHELKALMYEDKDLSFKILKLVGLRIRKLERKLEILVFKDARTRVIEFLIASTDSKVAKENSDEITAMRLTHQDIASLTGTSRQRVMTILNELKEKNLITFSRREIVVPDVGKLQ